MAAITIHGVTKQFGTQHVLDNVSLELNSNETVGLIGTNGSGKTTLFRIIAGELLPDQGSATRSKNLDVGFLRQDPDIELNRTLRAEVADAFTDLLVMEDQLHDLSSRMGEVEGDQLTELMDRYDRINARFIAAGGQTFETRLNEILGGLGFQPQEYEQPMRELSGGQRCRAALAKLLLTDRSFLLLDEPTNHLDIDAVRWLEKFLAGHRGGAVVVSHDRYLLDRMCDRIIEIEYRRVFSYPGNYSNFVQIKGNRELTQQRLFVQDKAFIEKERAFIAKHLAGQRSAEAKGRRKRLERRLRDGEFTTDTARKNNAVKLGFGPAQEGTGSIIRFDDLAMSFGDKELFSGLNVRVQAGQRLGITGPNGTGKTTLLRLLCGDLKPDAGSISCDAKLTLSYYAQTDDTVVADRSVLDEIRQVMPEISEESARSYLGQFLFSGDDVFKPLGALSGGEQSRVRLAKLILTPADVLILDEPTNHLDIPSREVLEDALLDYRGTVVVVSHDRYFLDRIVDRLLVMRRGSNELYDGNYSYYVEQIEHKRSVRESGSVANASGKGKKRSTGHGKPRSAPSPYDHMSVEEIESLMIERETELATLQDRFGDAEIYKDPALLAELRDQVDELEVEIASIDAAWQQRADA
jgi:ATP-binding cassette subfamily F protein 3